MLTSPAAGRLSGPSPPGGPCDVIPDDDDPSPPPVKGRRVAAMVVGSSGMLGSELCRILPGAIGVDRAPSPHTSLLVDLCDEAQVGKAARHINHMNAFTNS